MKRVLQVLVAATTVSAVIAAPAAAAAGPDRSGLQRELDNVVSASAVGALADDDVALLVFDLGEEFGKLLDCWWDLLASGYCGLYVQGFMDSTYPPSPADLGEPRSRARRRCRAR